MTAGMDGVFEQLQRHLGEASAAGPVVVPEVEAAGSSEDGLVEVVMGSGEVTAVRIDARGMRLSNAELADRVKEAVNAAVAQHTALLTEAVSGTDLGALSRSLDSVREEALASMQKYLSGMEEMLSRAAAQKEQYGL